MKRSTSTLLFLGACAIVLVSAGLFMRTLVSADITDVSPDDVTAVQAPLATSPLVAQAQSPENAAPTPAQQQAAAAPVSIPPSYPARLSIPGLNINAAVQNVGITAKDAIASPSNFTDVGWYGYSATPGNNGTAIIDGHVDNGLALAGVFKHLSDIKTGEHVYVTTHGGTKLDYVVTAVTIYNYQDVPVASLLAQSPNASQLALITCDGAWVGNQKTYDERLVVTASLVSNQ